VAHHQARRAPCELAGSLRRQDDQRKVVAHAFETIFNRNSRQVPAPFCRRLPANGGLWGFRSRHGAEAAVTS
jgi:hypothetical protein